jgi:hypothetical protein
VQAVEVAWNVSQEQGGRAPLAMVMTGLQKFGMPDRIPQIDAHARVPVIGHGRQMRIKRFMCAAFIVSGRFWSVIVSWLQSNW